MTKSPASERLAKVLSELMPDNEAFVWDQIQAAEQQAREDERRAAYKDAAEWCREQAHSLQAELDNLRAGSLHASMQPVKIRMRTMEDAFAHFEELAK